MPAGKARITIGKKGSHGCSGYPVVGGEGAVHGCHETLESAQNQQAAIYASMKREANKMWEGSAFEPVSKRDFSSKQRQRMASEGTAMPDGSYPIANRTDLMNAIRSWGRGGSDPKVKEHIKRRARALGAADMIPENWK